MFYTKDHEWIKPENKTATVGISDYAQEHLGDITFIDLPTVGKSFKQGDVFASIESVKAVSDIYMPIAGKIIAINSALENQPELVNQDAETNGWLVKIEMENADELNSLMNFDTYTHYIEGLE